MVKFEVGKTYSTGFDLRSQLHHLRDDREPHG